MRKTNAIWITAASALALAMAVNQAQARLVAMPAPVPLEDVMAKVEAWIKDHPKDASGYYVLGRVQALAWGYGEKIPLVWYDKSKLPEFGEYSTIRITREDTPVTGNGLQLITPHPPHGATNTADLAHLQASIDAYTKAVAMDPTNGLYEEGLAWMLQRRGDAGAAMAEDVKDLTALEKANFDQAIRQLAAPDFSARAAAGKLLLDAMPRCAGMLKAVPTDDPEVTARIAGVFKEYWDLQALSHYRNAYALTLQKDLLNQNATTTDGLVSADAAKQIQPLLADHPGAAKPGEMEELKKSLEKLADRQNQDAIFF